MLLKYLFLSILVFCLFPIAYSGEIDCHLKTFGKLVKHIESDPARSGNHGLSALKSHKDNHAFLTDNGRPSGIIVGPGKEMPEHLDDGVYVYLIVKIGDKTQIVYSDRFHGGGGDVIGHVNLYNKVKKEFGPADIQKVIGAGEFEIMNGEVARFDNGSGTFRPDTTHLHYAKDFFLTEKKLNIEEGRTAIIDHAKKEGSGLHENVKTIGLLKSVIDQNQELAKIRKRAQGLYKRLYDRLYKAPNRKPSPVAGKIHSDGLVSEYDPYFINRPMEDKFILFTFFVNTVNKEGFDHALLNAMGEGHLDYKNFSGEEKIKSIVDPESIKVLKKQIKGFEEVVNEILRLDEIRTGNE